MDTLFSRKPPLSLLCWPLNFRKNVLSLPPILPQDCRDYRCLRSHLASHVDSRDQLEAIRLEEQVLLPTCWSLSELLVLMTPEAWLDMEFRREHQ